MWRICFRSCHRSNEAGTAVGSGRPAGVVALIAGPSQETAMRCVGGKTVCSSAALAVLPGWPAASVCLITDACRSDPQWSLGWQPASMSIRMTASSHGLECQVDSHIAICARVEQQAKILDFTAPDGRSNPCIGIGAGIEQRSNDGYPCPNQTLTEQDYRHVPDSQRESISIRTIDSKPIREWPLVAPERVRRRHPAAYRQWLHGRSRQPSQFPSRSRRPYPATCPECSRAQSSEAVSTPSLELAPASSSIRTIAS